MDQVWDYIHLTSEDKTRRLNLNALHDEVKTWFTAEALDTLLRASQPVRRNRSVAIGWAALASAGVPS